MKKFSQIIIILIAVSTMLYAGDGKKFGKDITVKETTQVSSLLEKPDAFIGKTVRIEGTVLNVCKMKGCWMEVASDKEFQSIVVKVDDGVIVFPMEAKGKKAVVEGTLYAIEVENKEEHKDGEKENCAEEGEECVHKTKKYLLKGLGAEIDM